MEKGILKDENGFYCYINQKYYTTAIGLCNFLRTQSLTSEQYYLKYLGNPGKCNNCDKPTKYARLTTGYNRYCSDICAKKSAEHRIAVSQRFVNQPEKLAESVRKRRVTLSKMPKEERLKINQTRLNTVYERYGSDYFSEKARRQWERRTEEDVKSLVNKSNLTKKRNNVTYDNSYKNSHKKITIGEKTFTYQGYEDIVLNLLTQIVNVNDIKTGRDVPRIQLPEGKLYYPDIYINGMLIEVKSEYTYKVNLSLNLLKQYYSRKAGYKHIILVIHSSRLNKNRKLRNEEEYLKILRMAIRSQASNEEGSTTIP